MSPPRPQKVLRTIGYWNGPSSERVTPEQIASGCPVENRFIWPKDIVDPAWESAVRSSIVTYLSTAPKIVAYMGLSWCRFRCGIQHLGATELSDGIWVWPEGLAHYVEKHLIRLPDEFVAHLKTSDFRIPTEVWFKDPGFMRQYAVEWDMKFWEDWCNAQRKP
jgi:hypothetical protein